MKLNYRIRYCIILLVTLLPFKLFSQSSISGKVTSILDKNPIVGANIFITDIQLGTKTNVEGVFTFEKLPKTIVHIQISTEGYKTILKTVNLEKSLSIDVEMEPSVIELEDVLITSNNSKLTDNTPFPANSISQNEIRKYGANSVMKNLSYLPGVDRISIGNAIGKPIIRGLSFNQILLYSQGTRIENQQWDDHHDLGLSDIGVESVEIVRGPAALIYGADALGGALIFRDEKPAAFGTIATDANLGFESNTIGFNGDAGIKGTSKNGFFYGLRIGGSSQTSYQQGEDNDNNNNSQEEDAFAPNSKFMNTNGKFNTGLSGQWGVCKLSYSFLNQQSGIIEEEMSGSSQTQKDEKEQRDREMEAPYQDVTTHIVSLENTFFTGKSKINFNVAYQLNNRKEFEPLENKMKELAIGLKLNVTTYDIKWTSNAEKNFGLTIGSQGTFLQNKNNGKESLVPNANERDLAGYSLFRYDINKLNILGGVRMDFRNIEAETYENGIEEDTFIIRHSQAPVLIDTIPHPEVDFKKNYTPLSFSLGASFQPNKNLTLKLNCATGFSAPNYAQLGTFGKHEGTFRFERGNNEFNVMQNLEADLGLIWENEYITLNISGFINKIKDYIYLINSGDTMNKITPDGSDLLPIYDYKQGDATLSGFEAGFDIHPRNISWLDFNTNYSLTKGTLDNGGNLPYIASGKLVSELKLLKNKIGQLKNSYISLIVSNYEKQKDVTEYELSTDAYTLLDVHIGTSYKINKNLIQIGLFCTNILNIGYFNQLSLVKYIGVRDMGRNFGISMKIPLYFKEK